MRQFLCATFVLSAAYGGIAHAQDSDDYPRLSPPGFEFRENNRPGDPNFSRSWSTRPAQPFNPYMLPLEEPRVIPEPERQPRRKTSGPLVPPAALPQPVKPPAETAAPKPAQTIDAPKPLPQPQRTRMPAGPTMIPPHVVFTRAAGHWRENALEGFMRVVITRVSPRDETMRLYVQWIATDRQSDKFQLVDSVEVPEMYDWRIRFDDYDIERDDSELQIVLDTTALFTKVARKYLLTIGAPGNARLEAK